ncbi:MAG: hypothetical protein JXQ76_01660 [Campylobacterales bacterium]|nr:hypothetical protein [Campylobacterales bacterium]
MQKLLLASLLTTVTFLAFDTNVTQGDITIKVNDKTQEYKAGSTPKLNQGELVCYGSGDGVLHISADNYDAKISNESKNCKLLPSESNQTTNTALQDKYAKLFGDETMRGAAIDGISIRTGSSGKVDKTPITIKPKDKYLYIKSKTWSPRTITIQIFDTQGKVVATDANKNNPVTSFIFPASILKDGYRVKVTDGFGDVLMDSLVVVK